MSMFHKHNGNFVFSEYQFHHKSSSNHQNFKTLSICFVTTHKGSIDHHTSILPVGLN